MYDLLLEPVVDNLKVLLLDLNHLLLLVEILETIGKVETIATESINNSTVEAIAEDVVVALGLRRGDGASSYVVLVLEHYPIT